MQNIISIKHFINVYFNNKENLRIHFNTNRQPRGSIAIVIIEARTIETIFTFSESYKLTKDIFNFRNKFYLFLNPMLP